METWFHKIERYAEKVAVLDQGSPKKDRARKLFYESTLRHMDNAAKFLISNDIVALVSSEGFGKNVATLAKAGLLKLPFNPLLIEFEPPNVGGRWFICFRELTDDSRSFGAEAIYMYKDQQTTLYLSYPYSHLIVEDEAFQANEFDDASAGNAVAAAMMMATVGMTTKGVERERVVPPEKLNKARAKKKKALIPEYTTMRVGYVYDRNGNAVPWTEAGGPRALHWRRAHKRRQRYGPGLSQIKEILIEACLVNYNPGDDVPEMPKRKVKV